MTTVVTRSDDELVHAWRAGDRDAGNDLFERHFESIYAFVRSKTGQRVEDLVQDTFMVIVEGPHKWRGSGSFRAYLFGVARMHLLNHYRTLGRELERIDTLRDSVHALDPTPSEFVGHDEDRRRLHDALRRIPIDHQVALELTYWEELSGKEVAQVLEISPNTVRSRLHRARAALGEAMREMGVTDSVARRTLAAFDRAP